MRRATAERLGLRYEPDDEDEKPRLGESCGGCVKTFFFGMRGGNHVRRKTLDGENNPGQDNAIRAMEGD